MNINRFKINSVLFFHTIWVLFIYLTWPMIFYNHIFNKAYLLIMILTLASSWGLGGCWLSNLENNLRKKYDPKSVYKERCIKYYGKRWLHLDIPQYLIRSVFGFLLLVSFYLFLIH